VDSLTNYFAVNLFYRFRFEKSALVPCQNEEERTNVLARRYVEKMRSVTSFFYATICFIGINGFVIYLWLQHQITTGGVAQVFGTMWNIATVMWAVGGALPAFFQSFGIGKADITLKSLRHQIALIPQDPVLFHRTLRENISYGKPEATETEIFSAAELAHCDEFIQNIPAGYEAKVGERGTKLSGGEKQRIAIARAILVDAPILILDEATSSLDSVTEKYIHDSLSKLMQGRTTIVIAHRLSTLSRMDRILVFDKDRIVEEGTHATLMSKDGLYARMWNMQVGGFLPEKPR
jgi:ABC-type phosphate transport system ATPase subunit